MLDFDKYECYNLPHVTTFPGFSYGDIGHADKVCIYRWFTRNYSGRAKYLNFFEISIVAFNVCNLNQIGTQSIVFF